MGLGVSIFDILVPIGYMILLTSVTSEFSATERDLSYNSVNVFNFRTVGSGKRNGLQQWSQKTKYLRATALNHLQASKINEKTKGN